MHNVFISYHHKNDQYYKEQLLFINRIYKIFIDGSVDIGEISDDLDDDSIRKIIRDEYLKDTSVTIVLVGLETMKRKHVDWEIYSSMIDGKVNKKSGILVVNLPSTNCIYYTTSHDGEKEKIYPEMTTWISIDNRSEYESRYPFLPARIIDNLLNRDARISVVNWNKIEQSPSTLAFLIEATFNDRSNCTYDLSRSMRRADS